MPGTPNSTRRRPLGAVVTATGLAAVLLVMAPPLLALLAAVGAAGVWCYLLDVPVARPDPGAVPVGLDAPRAGIDDGLAGSPFRRPPQPIVMRWSTPSQTSKQRVNRRSGAPASSSTVNRTPCMSSPSDTESRSSTRSQPLVL